MFVKILGTIDLVAALTFLTVLFGIEPYIQIILFSSLLLIIKGSIFFGDMLSLVDIIAGAILIINVIIALPSIVLWIPAFLLFAKGFLSFA